MSEVRTEVTQYTVSAAPGGDAMNDSLYAIEVQQAIQIDGTELWAVRWKGRCLNGRGEWTMEPIPSYRTEQFLKAHRFDLATALRLARAAAPKITVNGRGPDGSRRDDGG